MSFGVSKGGKLYKALWFKLELLEHTIRRTVITEQATWPNKKSLCDVTSSLAGLLMPESIGRDMTCYL